nr:MAG TPA: hypothetical protein [Caudoviricetes sp.]
MVLKVTAITFTTPGRLYYKLFTLYLYWSTFPYYLS